MNPKHFYSRREGEEGTGAAIPFKSGQASPVPPRQGGVEPAAKTLVFRFRVWILFVLYLLGFLAPWQHLFGTKPNTTLWLAVSTLLPRTGWVGLQTATLIVTIVALCCIVAGAVLRVSSTAYLGAPVMLDPTMHGSRLVAAGPYRYVRNPLYLGHGLLALGLSILMPPSGALVFLVALFLLQWALISSEESFLAASLGSLWQDYRRQVPRLVPRPMAIIASSQTRPHWLQALFAEIYPVGFALCFAVFVWRYNVLILIKCLIICFGLSLIARAVRTPRAADSATAQR